MAEDVGGGGALRLALAQMCSADSHAANIETVSELAEEAAAAGAELLCLPEVAGLMNSDAAAARAVITRPEVDPFLLTCQDLAQRYGLWIHTGSSPVLAADGRFLNRSTVIDAAGQVRAVYDKVHLFDVTLEGRAPIGESKRFAPGDHAALVETPWGPWGLSICYDLRFAAFYTPYARAEATVIFVPSAFTVPTGKAHWEVLLRARAIETGAYIVAAAQSGHHADGRETYGHSLVVSPWGEVVVDMGTRAPALSLVTLDLSEPSRARGQTPAWRGGRDVPLRRS